MSNLMRSLIDRLQRPFRSIIMTPLERRYSKYHSLNEGAKKNGISVIAGISLTVNLIMGAGFLSLPLLIAKSGLILGPAVMLIGCLLLRTTGIYEAELMCRAEAVIKAHLNPQTHAGLHIEEAPALSVTKKEKEKEAKEAMQIKGHAFSMVEICEVFQCRKIQKIYIGILVFFLFFSMVGYVSVFSTSMSNYVAVPMIFEGQTCRVSHDAVGCHQLKTFYICIMAILVIPLSLIGIKEQVKFQMFMTSMRLVIVFLMSGTCLYASLSGSQVFGSSFGNTVNENLVSMSEIYQIVPVTFFAQNINAFVSLVVQDLGDKQSVKSVLSVGVFITYIFYTLIGCAVAYYFGSSVAPSANVMWEYFTGGYSAQPFWVDFVSFFVILFPAFDVLSVFPLCGMTMASNAMAGFYHDRIDKAETDNFIVRFFRLSSVIPVLVCAFFIGDRLDTVLMYAGMCAIPLSMIIPPYLNFVSQKVVKEELGFPTAQTPFTTIWSHPNALVTIGTLGSLLLVLVFSMSTIQLISNP